jgi:hypothetical protein
VTIARTMYGERSAPSAPNGELIVWNSRRMADFTPYPGPSAGEHSSPDTAYVVVVTCSLSQGMFDGEPVTAAMTYEAASDLMAQVAAGQSNAVLPDDVDLVAEVSPAHLIAYRGGNLMRKAVTYDVRLARVVFSR